MRRQNFVRFFLVVFLAVFAISAHVDTKDGQDGALSTVTIDQALLWLPANTETILVAREPF
jgi:hypothetical protein